ncbi:thiamine-phosphate pyrophosphorylase [Litoreibacter halocynthiae]|uniref:Thiamine-phosphate pyrophosphorylase n=1 Tax=Litoreibacter halocynthiae TaxID=1242689 RepID=A0A4R7LQE2_9RHOB|nr:thiamine phosphate synthase [Litoreibacter halocynthiae]TDT77709.1 thiamine-phosphate pyrophosphorylase [Litoreibacter halocynthiae]
MAQNETAQEGPETPQVYLITPPEFELSSFPDTLSRVLDSCEIACLRLSLATKDEDKIARAADLIREQAHARDIPLVIDSHFLLVERLGLDGVHLLDGARSVRYVRKEIGPDAVIGAFCGPSRHEGMSAGESGADYVSLGPIGETVLGDGQIAETEAFEWWSQMIELPIVAEGAVNIAAIERLAPYTDFFAIGEEIWREDDPSAALKALLAPLG